MTSPEIATAYISVVPSLRGFPGMLRTQMVGPITTAGGQAGDAAGQAVGSRIGPAMKAGVAAAAVAAGALLAKGIADSFERGRVQNRLQAQLGATTQVADRYGKIAGELYAGNLVDSFESGAAAIRQVASAGLLPPDATNAQIRELSGQLYDVAYTFDADMELVSRSVSAMLTNGIAPSAEVALDTITAGFQRLGPNAEDLLDTFQEYSNQFEKLGLDSHTALGLMQQGLQGGARDTDKVADALKEFSIRAIDMSESSQDAYEAIGLSAEEMEAKISQGGEGAREGLQQVLDGLRAMGRGADQEAAAVGLFGTQVEDMGQSLYSLDLTTAVEGLGEIGGAADELGDTLHRGAGFEVERFRRRMETALVDFAGNEVIPALTSVATFARDDLAPAFRSAADTLTTGAGNVWGWVSQIPAVGDLRTDISDAVTSLGDLGPAFEDAGAAATDRFVPALRSAGDYIADRLEPVISTIAAFASDHMVPAFRDMGERLADFGQKLWPVSKGIIIFQGAVAAAVLWLASKMAPILGSIAGPVMGAFYRVLTLVLTPLEWLLDGIMAVADGAVWLWQAMQPGGAILGTLADAVSAVRDGFVSMWGTVQPVLETAWTVIKTIFTAIVVVALAPVIVTLGALGAAAWALWNTAIKPTFSAFADLAKWLNETVIQPAFRGISSAASATGRVFNAVFSAIGDLVSATWRNVVQPTFGAVRTGISAVGDSAVWLRDRAIRPVWDWIADRTSWLWDHGIKPPFDKIKEGVSAVGDAFGDAKDFIGDQWDGLKDIVREPVQFIIDVVYNNGIRKLWNTVADVVGAATLPSVRLGGYATGGILPGYTPGRDVHVAALSGGEAVMRPEFTRGAGAGWVNHMNHVARTQGVGGVRSAMEGAGGSLPGYFLGGIVGKVGGWVSQGIDWARETGAGWIGDKLRQVVDAAASQIPGAATDYGQLIAKIPGAFVGKLTDLVAGREADMGGTWQKPLGSPIGTRYGVAGPMWSSGHHTGTDFPAPTGTPIRAVADGIISAIGNGGPYGKHMRLSHPGGYQSFYAHLSSFIKSVGDQVARGDQIGRVGSTGNSSGPHLHLEAYKSGARINPETLFDNGGWLMPGAQLTRNDTGKPEPVLTSQQWSSISTLAANGATGLQPGDRLVLTLDGQRELEAYVDSRAEATISSTLVRPAGIGRRYA